jgi:oxygen-independent coproporphyrinogen-3 oxidase
VLRLPPLSLYVHVPWCERKCPYCDFNSHVADGAPPFTAYRERLLEDLEQDLGWLQGRTIGTVFFGGGTPSLFPAGEMAQLLEGIRARVPLAADAELTLEANPGSAERAKFSAFRAAGINRLSIGVQSFDDDCLRALGRIHDARAAHAAIDAAIDAGFDNFNIDLMHGLPGQDAASAAADLEQALAHGAPHVSWYQLTIERNTRFHTAPPQLPGEDTLADIQDRGEALLAAHGLAQYEVSAFARTGRRCAHNLNYWNFGDYLGIGAGAHGKVTLAEEGRVVRTQRTRVPRDYLSGEVASLRRASAVEAAELPLEYLMNALRLREGSPAAQFAARTGARLETLAGTLASLREQGLLDADPGLLRATALGFRHLDALLSRLA